MVPRWWAGAAVACGGLAVLVGPAPADAVSPQSLTATEAPVPSGMGANPSITLKQVACPAAGSCVAVGSASTLSDGALGVIETLSGGTWSLRVAPVPAGAGTPGTGRQSVSLLSVSCPADGSCVAVGTYRDTANYVWPLVETLSSGTWSATTGALPADAGTDAGGDANATLPSVTCPAAGSCVAVGSYENTSAATTGLIDTLTAGNWSAIKAPVPSGAGAGTESLSVVSCGSAASCAAAGTYPDASAHTQGLFDALASGSWSATAAPLPGDAAANPAVHPNAVSCPAAGACVVAGTYTSSTGTAAVLDTLASGTWSGTRAPVPSGAGTGNQALKGVACTSSTSCVAVGSYPDAANRTTALIDTLASGTWSATAGPEPANAGTDGGGTQNSTLTQVACPAAGSCVAVGSYEDSSAFTWGLIDTLSSGTWTATVGPEPANAGTDGAGTQSASLSSVACASSTACVATGTYKDANPRTEGLIDVLSSGTWSGTEAPLPASPPADPDISVQSISCTSATWCVAVGFTEDGAAHGWGLIETLSLGTWTATVAPEPANGGTTLGYLESVSCPSTGSCVAVGAYADTSGYSFGLIETLSGGTWTATQAPEPANAGTEATYSQTANLRSVSCPSTGSCVAVGLYYDSSTRIAGLVDTLSSGTWAATEIVQPANGGTDAALDLYDPVAVVTCPAAGSCVAGGTYEDNSGLHFHGLLDTLSSGTWTAVAAPLPANGAATSSSSAISVTSVVCQAVGSCVAVGDYPDASSYQWGLIDKLSSGTWTATEAPEPAGAGTDAGASQSATLSSVSCPAAGTCVAVGSYEDSSKETWGLVVTLSGGSWTAAQAAEPANAGTDGAGTQSAALDGVGCPSTSWCVVAGTYENANGYTVGYLETGSAGAWTVSADPEPANAGTDAAGTHKVSVGLVGCSADGGCTAAGSYDDSGPTTEGLFVTVVPPAPTVTSISPASGPSAGGTSVTVTGTWFFPGATTVFGAASAATTTASPTSLTATSPPGAGAVDVVVTTAGGTSGAGPADVFTYPGGTLTLAASPNLYWGVVQNGYDQWASASATPLSGCTAGGSGTTCSGGSPPMLEVLDTTGSGSGWALTAYRTDGAVPTGSRLNFDGAGSTTPGTSVLSSVATFPFANTAPATTCDFGSGCVVATPAGSCAHPALGVTTCPSYPVNVLSGTSSTTQVDLYSAAAGSGKGDVCLASGTATGPSCTGTTPTGLLDLGVPANAPAGTKVAIFTLTVSSGP